MLLAVLLLLIRETAFLQVNIRPHFIAVVLHVLNFCLEVLNLFSKNLSDALNWDYILFEISQIGLKLMQR